MEEEAKPERHRGEKALAIAKRIIRGILVAITITVMAGALLLGTFMLPPVQRWTRDAVVKTMEKGLGVDVEIGKLVYFPFNTLGIDDIIIYGSDQKEMISLGNARVNVGISSLWRKALVLSSINADSMMVDIHAVTDSAGNRILNISALQRSDNDTTDTAPLDIEIGELDASNGRVKYAGLDNRHIDIENIRISLRDIIHNGNQSSVNIRRISAYDSRNGKWGNISGEINQKGDTIDIGYIRMGYGSSKIDIDHSLVSTDELNAYNIELSNATLHAQDIAPYIPQAKLPEKLILTASGHISGTKDKIEGSNIMVTNGAYTSLKTNIMIDGLQDIDHAAVNIDCQQMATTLGDIGMMTGEEINPMTDLALGLITYKGQVTGWMSNMNLNGQLSTNIGTLKTAVRASTQGVKTEQGADADIEITGEIKTNKIDLSQLTENKVGTVAFDSDFKWFLDQTDGESRGVESVYAKAKANIKEITCLDYTYHDIIIDGITSPRYHSGFIKLDDENGKITIVGQYDEKNSIAAGGNRLDITAKVENFRTGKTNLTPNIDATLNVSAGLNAIGQEMEHADAELWITGLDFRDSTRVAQADNFSLQIECDEENTKNIMLQSDHLNGWGKGSFMYGDIAEELYRQIYPHISVLLDKKPQKRPEPVELEMEIDYSNADQYIQFFDNEIKLAKTGKIHAEINSETDSTYIELNIGSIEYGDTSKKGAFHRQRNTVGTIGVGASGISMTLKADEMTIPHIGNIGSVKLKNSINRNLITTDLMWDDMVNKKSGGDLSATTLLSKTDDNKLMANISLDQSKITLRSHEWTLHKSDMEVSHDHLYVNKFRFDLRDRYIAVDGRASSKTEDTLAININKMTIEDILPADPYERYTLAGDLNADLKCIGIYDKPVINGKIAIDRFHVDEDNLEHLDVAAQWSTEMKQLGLDVKIVTGGKTRAHGIGGIDSEASHMSLNFDIDSLSLGFLNFYLAKSVSNLQGTTTGKLQLHGPLNDIGLDARLTANRTTFRVNSTMVDYVFDKNDSVILSPDNMEIRQVRVSDKYGRRGVFDGYIRHEMFSNLYYDLNFKVNDMLALDMAGGENPSYYGTIFANGNLSVKGTTDNTNIVINATTRPGTVFSILPNATSDRGDTKYIQFKSANEQNEEKEEFEEDKKLKADMSLGKVNSWVVADLNVRIEPTSKVSVIIDPLTDNRIDATGKGDLKLYFDRAGDLSINGLYTIEEGKYKFSLQNVINKQFGINSGSTIEWDGEPFDPILNINAQYEVKASLYDLVQNSAAGQDLKKRVPIFCNLALSERMSDPGIKFKIEVPSMMKSNQYIIDQYITTEEETNRQVFSLLAFDRFYASEEATGTQNNMTTSAVAAMTLSELITNQFSNWLSQNKYNLNIGINYRPGDEVTQEEYELALSTRMLNNKIILSGNIGYGRNTNETSEGSVIGDFDMEVKIKGNLSAKAYTHSNNDIIYETSPTTQGVGITYREEFNSWGELFRKYWNKITTRRKKEAVEEKTEKEGNDNKTP